MSGIAGIVAPGQKTIVERMLDAIGHRGRTGRTIVEHAAGTVGVVWDDGDVNPVSSTAAWRMVRDSAGPGHLAQAEIFGDTLTLVRDEIGVAPLYLAETQEGFNAFASEVKALIGLGSDIREFPPGHRHIERGLEPYYTLQEQAPLSDPPEIIAGELRNLLNASVEKNIAASRGDIGSWLSGGIDSCAIAALARPHLKRLHTFVGGVAGAPDVVHARQAAEHLKTEHREIIVSADEMFKILPDVIYHLESFDALLVRSSIMNFLVARQASQHVASVFSGEGGDELFAGYDYLKNVPQQKLAAELVDITSRLHNTALQRVDRSASASGLTAHVPFLDPAVVDYALRIPAAYKIRNGLEKWVLREALRGLLPPAIVERPKAKFWDGAGVREEIAAHAEKQISDADFRKERTLLNGWELDSKEELFYYRIFREHFGEWSDLSWMGRTQGAPRENASA